MLLTSFKYGEGDLPMFHVGDKVNYYAAKDSTYSCTVVECYDKHIYNTTVHHYKIQTTLPGSLLTVYETELRKY